MDFVVTGTIGYLVSKMHTRRYGTPCIRDVLYADGQFVATSRVTVDILLFEKDVRADQSGLGSTFRDYVTGRCVVGMHCMHAMKESLCKADMIEGNVTG